MGNFRTGGFSNKNKTLSLHTQFKCIKMTYYTAKNTIPLHADYKMELCIRYGREQKIKRIKQINITFAAEKQ